MNRYDCDRVQDLLPAVARGELLDHESRATRHHLEGCAACREELALVRLIQQSLDPVPAALEARILAAVGDDVLVHPSVNRPHHGPHHGWSPARVAMAAAVATAVIGGALVLDRLGDLLPGAAPATDFELAGVPSLNWPGEDPLLHTAPLEELTVEELEVLLAEMDS